MSSVRKILDGKEGETVEETAFVENCLDVLMI